MKKTVKVVLSVAVVALVTIPTIAICQIGILPPVGTILFLK
ncbi:hypothetical protein [Inconstantimicrobium mannanitabidum]|uniref:Uncharacterized protein n=1 Tax=Inconstantimicrobium mannanitabidum TaxID=1604901 RepID=A0ACB5RAU8_9CLOT|nr:hypothetical protein [Clostridium sp. TW13]GKX66167.1 hypothetical protein rsdtw13_14250 [Clostridium sp. TW13]